MHYVKVESSARCSRTESCDYPQWKALNWKFPLRTASSQAGTLPSSLICDASVLFEALGLAACLGGHHTAGEHLPFAYPSFTLKSSPKSHLVSGALHCVPDIPDFMPSTCQPFLLRAESLQHVVCRISLKLSIYSSGVLRLLDASVSVSTQSLT